jgi:alanyl-tRNA synthetase
MFITGDPSQLTLFRHVANTGDIKDFVITEEIGIAKGIRRIVAVTGQEAQDIGRLAQSLQEKLDILEQSDGKIKESGLKSFSVVRADSPSIRNDSSSSF